MSKGLTKDKDSKLINGVKKGDKKYTQEIISFISDSIARELSERTNITLTDCKYVLRVINKIIFDRLAVGESIRFHGAGTINIRNVGPTKMYSPIIDNDDGEKGGYITKQSFYKFSFTPSRYLKDVLYFDEDKYIDKYN